MVAMEANKEPNTANYDEEENTEEQETISERKLIVPLMQFDDCLQLVQFESDSNWSPPWSVRKTVMFSVPYF